MPHAFPAPHGSRVARLQVRLRQAQQSVFSAVQPIQPQRANFGGIHRSCGQLPYVIKCCTPFSVVRAPASCARSELRVRYDDLGSQTYPRVFFDPPSQKLWQHFRVQQNSAWFKWPNWFPQRPHMASNIVSHVSPQQLHPADLPRVQPPVTCHASPLRKLVPYQAPSANLLLAVAPNSCINLVDAFARDPFFTSY